MIKYTTIATRKNVAKWLDIDPIKLAHWKREGMPANCHAPKVGYWKIKPICEWLIIKKQKSPVKKKAVEILGIIKKQEKGETVEPIGKKKAPAKRGKKAPAKTLTLSQDEGFEACVSRARSIELQMGLLVAEKFNEDPLLAADFFGVWQKAQDALCKLEKQLDDILLKRQAVVNIDEASEVFFKLMGPVKARFKSLGPDVSLDLAGMENPGEIGAFITAKVREIFQEISKGMKK